MNYLTLLNIDGGNSMFLIDKVLYLHDRIGYSRKQGVRIGQNCSIMGNSFPFGTEPYLVTIGDHVRINDGVRFFTHDGSVWVLRGLAGEEGFPKNLNNIDLFGKITVGNNVQIGSNALILPNVSIGNNVIIGAGAIVTRSVPDNSVAVGIPARVISSIGDFYKKHRAEFMHTKNMDPSSKKDFVLKNIDKLDGE